MTRLDKTARALERRRNFLRAELAQAPLPYQGIDVWDAKELAALDEALVALYDTGRATRRPGVEPRCRTYEYFPSQYEQAIERVRKLLDVPGFDDHDLLRAALGEHAHGCAAEPCTCQFGDIRTTQLGTAA